MKSTLALLFLSATVAFSQTVIRPYVPTPQPVVVYTVTPSPFGKADGVRLSGSDGSSGTIRANPFSAGDTRIPAVITITPAPSFPAFKPLF